MARREWNPKLRLRAGKLIHPATIESPTLTQTASGDLAPSTWAEVAETYASILPLSGRDLWNAQQIQPDLTHQIECRYVPGVKSNMRIVIGSRIFHIAEPPENVEERNIVLRLLCIEKE